jgi:hypothetical protein
MVSQLKGGPGEEKGDVPIGGHSTAASSFGNCRVDDEVTKHTHRVIDTHQFNNCSAIKEEAGSTHVNFPWQSFNGC